jgi:hypothetical protein
MLHTGALRVRTRWPAFIPFAVSMSSAGWLGWSVVRLVPRAPGLEAATAGAFGFGRCGVAAMEAAREWAYQPLGTFPLGAHTLACDLTLERGSSRRPLVRNHEIDPAEFVPTAGVYFRGAIAFPVEIVPTIDEAIPPRSSPELDAAVRSALSLALCPRGLVTVLFLVPDVDRHPELAHLGLALTIDFVRDGVVVDRRRVQGSAGPTSEPRVASGPEVLDTAATETIPASAQGGAQERSRWSVRVQGTARDVLALWSAETRWSGTLELTLDELLARERAIAPEERPGWGVRDPR